MGLSGYFERTTSKRPTCQKLAFQGISSHLRTLYTFATLENTIIIFLSPQNLGTILSPKRN